MAINRNYSYNPANYPYSTSNLRKNPTAYTGGTSSAFDVVDTGAVGGCGATGATNPAADQTFMPMNAAADATGQPSAMQLLSTIVSTLITIIQSLQGGGVPGGTSTSAFANGDGSPVDDTSDFSDPGTDTVGGRTTGGTTSGIKNGTTNPAQKATLDDSLAKIASDPDGAKLLAQAKKAGVTIKVGDPAAAAQGAGAKDQTVVECPACQQAAKLQAAGDVQGAARVRAQDTRDGGKSVAKDGTVQVNGVTLSDNKTGQITVVVRDPSNIKTIAHELVHAVSTKDSNSQQEEGIADVIGSRIAHNVGDTKDALQGSDEQIYLNKMQYYPNLPNSNNIRQTLAALGINVSV